MYYFEYNYDIVSDLIHKQHDMFYYMTESLIKRIVL